MMSSFPLVSFLITLLLAAAVCTHGNEPVKDTAGKPVLVRVQYFIQPVETKSNNGGGLYPAAVKVPPVCPLGITQSLPYLPGLPVSFHYHGLTMEPTVNTSVDVIIKFMPSNGPVCPEFSPLWEVDDDSSSASNEPAILLGGSGQSSNSQFKIEKVAGAGENTYKLTGTTPGGISGTVGTTQGGISGVKLVLTNDDAKTLLVKFDKVHDATPSTSRVDKLGLRMFPFY